METKNTVGTKVSKTVELVDNHDRISNLSDDVLYHIFSNLQTIELVRLSVLSKRWRYLWTSMPYLNFNQSEMLNAYALQEKFIHFINCVLFFRNVSDIKMLRVSSTKFCDGWTTYWWLDIARKRNVQEIDFNIRPCPSPESNEFPGLLFGKSLVVLKLNTNFHRIPILTGCRGLTSLHLVSIFITNEDFIKDIFTGCPVIENFSMEWCLMKIEVLEILSSSLKNLTLVNNGLRMFDRPNGSFEGLLKVSAPNLLSFIYVGGKLCDNFFENLSSLESASIHVLSHREQPDQHLCRMLGRFSNASRLKLTFSFFEYYTVTVDKPVCFPAAFSKLKFLKLFAGFIECDLREIFHLLKYCPILEVLAIDTTKYGAQGDPKQKETWFDASFCLTDHLKRVEIINSLATESDLEFIELILANGKGMEELTFTWIKSWEKKIKQFQKVYEFPKASPNVVISFPKHNAQKPFWWKYIPGLDKFFSE